MITSKIASVTFMYRGKHYTYVYATKAFDCLLKIEEGPESDATVSEIFSTNCHELKGYERPKLPSEAQILFCREWSRTVIPESVVSENPVLRSIPPEFQARLDISGGRSFLKVARADVSMPIWWLGQVIGHANEAHFKDVCREGLVAKINWPSDLRMEVESGSHNTKQ